MRVGRRSLLIALVVALPAGAQEPVVERFQNSWFGGIKVGRQGFATPTEGGFTPTLLGVETMITRTIGGLYASLDMASFRQRALVSDPAASNGVRPVALENLRRFTIAAIAA